MNRTTAYPDRVNRPTRPDRTAGAAVAAVAALAGLTALASTAACTMPTAAEIAGVDNAGECPFAPDESITGPVRIGWMALTNGDLVARDRGLLEACAPNATITWNRLESAADATQALSSESVDLTVMGSTGVFRALSKPLDQDLRVIWVQDVIGSAEALVAKDPSVERIEDLRGRSVAVPFTSTSHFSLMMALEDAGLDPARDVTLVNLAPDKIPAAWRSAQIDAAWVWDPVKSALMEGGHEVMSSADTAAAGHPTQDLVVARAAFARDNGAFLRVWARAQDHAGSVVRDDPSAAAAAAAPDLGVPAADVEAQFPGYRYPDAADIAGGELLGGGMVPVCEAVARFLAEQREVDEAASVDRCASALEPAYARAAADASPSGTALPSGTTAPSDAATERTDR